LCFKTGESRRNAGRIQPYQGLTDFDHITVLDKDFLHDAAFEMLDRLVGAGHLHRTGRQYSAFERNHS